uniref:Two-component response regulator, controling glutamine utilization n=1 Tax=Loigolactobacillus rennini TaxID=238013 RepID=A0A1K2I4F8_9LACO|nr:Two-component response regulator, controling glutamine utilization [Loigolactobacillus rennini]
MNFYIIDDDPVIIPLLAQIIETKMDNEIIGTASDSQSARKELAVLPVDIVLIDLLMPHLSGIELVKQIRQLKPKLHFIMVSKVRDHDLRQEAYQAGIDFFIDKPINKIEVEKVVQQVSQLIQMESKLSNIQQLLGTTTTARTDPIQAAMKRINSLLNYLGITSQAGAKDILNVCQLMLTEQVSFNELDLRISFGCSEHERKIMLQRMRRAAKAGLTNLATLSLDHFGDDLLLEYANSLYEYQNVKNEALKLQHQHETGGKISLNHFFQGLIEQGQSE